jgi:hypothetical protein
MNRVPTACGCPSDVNADGARDGRDIAGFVACLLDPDDGCACADANGNGDVEALDIAVFAGSVVSGTACP